MLTQEVHGGSVGPDVEGGGCTGVGDPVSQGGRAQWQTPAGGEALQG